VKKRIWFHNFNYLKDLLYCYASHFILFMCNFRIIVFLILCWGMQIAMCKVKWSNLIPEVKLHLKLSDINVNIVAWTLCISHLYWSMPVSKDSTLTWIYNYGKPFAQAFLPRLCKIAKSALPFGYFAMLTYQFAKSVLPNCKVHIAKLPSPLHPVYCRPEFQAAHKMFLFPSCPIPELFSGLPICLPQKIRLPLILFYFQGCIGLRPPPPPPILLQKFSLIRLYLVHFIFLLCNLWFSCNLIGLRIVQIMLSEMKS